jgi:hypothetical protein
MDYREIDMVNRVDYIVLQNESDSLLREIAGLGWLRSSEHTRKRFIADLERINHTFDGQYRFQRILPLLDARHRLIQVNAL